jgi:predicted dehydrogenase
MKKRNINRRDFIQKSLTGLAGAAILPTILPSCVQHKGANDRLLIGHIGVGSRGGSELKNYFLPLNDARSVAFCDVHTDIRTKGADYVNKFYQKQGMSTPECKAYLDFEEILERDDIDAVHITTPDHWHVPAAIKAARAGKHVMVAKPLGLSYPNYLKLDKVLKENDVRFHYGTQQRSYEYFQMGVDMIKNGDIGEIEKVLVWAPGKNNVSSPSCTEVPVPADFDYDKWSGPARLNPYCPDRVTNNSSWFQNDYSIGFLAGWGAHPLDIMVWALKDKVSGKYTCEGNGKFWDEGGMYNNILSWDLDYNYESGMKVHFVSTDVALSTGLLDDHITRRKNGNGTTFYGTKGWISLSRGSVESNIPELDKKLNSHRKDRNGSLSGNNTMGQLFVDAIHGKIAEPCPLDEAIMSDTISHMGNIAIRRGKKVTWDPKRGEVVGDAEGNALFTREMREPYSV